MGSDKNLNSDALMSNYCVLLFAVAVFIIHACKSPRSNLWESALYSRSLGLSSYTFIFLLAHEIGQFISFSFAELYL